MSRALTPEFALVCACCAWPPGAARDERVRAAAARVDWSRASGLAARHRVEGLVHAALLDSGVELPTDIATHLAGRARDVALRSLASAVEAARLQTALRAVGVASLVLKGAAVEVLAYGGLGRKDAWDIDLLVSPVEVTAACDEMKIAGYALTDPIGLSAAQFGEFVGLSRECTFVRREDGRIVELHWGLADGPVLLKGLSVDSPSREVAVTPDLRLTTFAQEETFAYLCVHGAMHGWARLKWLADLAALLSSETPAIVEELYTRARTLGAGLCPDQALILCESLLGLDIGKTLSAELPASASVRRLERHALAALTAPEPPTGLTLKRLAAELTLTGSPGAGMAQLRYRSIGTHDRIHTPLPQWLAFLYPLMRWPSWLWRRIRR